MSKMKAVQVSEPEGEFEIVEKSLPIPGPDQVRIKVKACGICHSDAFVKEGLWPEIEYPRVPGHEVVGLIDVVGENVTEWNEGDLVGVGWHGGHCFSCESCRQGDFVNCDEAIATGIFVDGGYAEYMVANREGVAKVPEDISVEEAASLLCAGITTYNSLRNSSARPGDIVAIQGIGGLGHLGVQFASHMGFHTVALSRGEEKKELALQLGAHTYIDTEKEDPIAVLSEMGGAKVILATVPSAKAISPLVDGLGKDGEIIVVGADDEPLEISPLQLIMGRKKVKGWPSGTARDSEATLNFCSLTGIRPKIETFPLEKAEEAYQRMMSNEARFRVILTVD